MIVAFVLDPQGQINFVAFCFETLHSKDSAKYAKMKNMMKDVLNKLFEAYIAQHLKSSASASVSAFPSVSAGVSASNGLTFMNEENEAFENFFSKYTRDHVELSSELDIYLVESVEHQASNILGTLFDIFVANNKRCACHSSV